MDVLSAAQRVRDSRRATTVAVACVLLGQVPTVLVYNGIFVFGESAYGVAFGWFVGALLWSLYAAVHLLAPLADVLSHPDRDSWGPFQTVNIYTYVSSHQLGIRLLHGILGFWVLLSGTLLLLLDGALLVGPAIVGLLAVLVMSLHVGVTTPSEEIQQQF